MGGGGGVAAGVVRLTGWIFCACFSFFVHRHEAPLIANLIARMKLFEMNSVISDTAEYGCYLYDQECQPLLQDFMSTVETDVIGQAYNVGGR